MTYTIRMVRSSQFIEPGLGVSAYLDFGARLFSTQWPPYGAHILQGLLSQFVQSLFWRIVHLFVWPVTSAKYALCRGPFVVLSPSISTLVSPLAIGQSRGEQKIHISIWGIVCLFVSVYLTVCYLVCLFVVMSPSILTLVSPPIIISTSHLMESLRSPLAERNPISQSSV